MMRGNQRGARRTTRGVAALIVTLAMAASFLLPLGWQTALAEDAIEPADDIVVAGGAIESADDIVTVESVEDEGTLLVVADAQLQSETINLTGTTSAAGHTYKGSKFEVTGEGYCDSDKGAHVYQENGTVYYVKVSSLDDTIIKKVDVHFSRYSAWDFGTMGLVVAPNTDGIYVEAEFEPVLNEYDEEIPGEATINPVGEDVTAVRFGSVSSNASNDEPCIDKVTVYYEGKAANTLQASAVKATQTLTYKTDAQKLPTASVFNVSGAQGAVTYSKKSGDAGITVSSTGEVTVKGGQAAGTYKAVFAIRAAGNDTYDEATKEVPVTFVVNKAANTLKASAVKAKQTLTYKTKAQNLKATAVFNVSGAQGAVSYSKKSGDAGITVSSDGKVALKKGLAAGSYKVVFAVTAAGDANHNAATKEVTVTFAVGKAKNPIVAKAVARAVKASKVKKKAATVACPLKATKQVGKLTYTRLKSGSSKYLTAVSKKNGKVTVKKGTPKGTYKIKIKVTAAGNQNYKAGSKTVTCKVKVK